MKNDAFLPPIPPFLYFFEAGAKECRKKEVALQMKFKNVHLYGLHKSFPLFSL